MITLFIGIADQGRTFRISTENNADSDKAKGFMVFITLLKQHDYNYSYTNEDIRKYKAIKHVRRHIYQEH